MQEGKKLAPPEVEIVGKPKKDFEMNILHMIKEIKELKT